MADHAVPHFHNDAGVTVVRVGSKKFMCMGALPPFDHPHVFLDMGDEAEIICPYCSTHFKFEPSLGPAEAIPPECTFAEAAA